MSVNFGGVTHPWPPTLPPQTLAGVTDPFGYTFPLNLNASSEFFPAQYPGRH